MYQKDKKYKVELKVQKYNKKRNKLKYIRF